jgi:hypothetical protein
MSHSPGKTENRSKGQASEIRQMCWKMVQSNEKHRSYTDKQHWYRFHATRTRKVHKADARQFLDLNKRTPAEKKTF